MEISKIFWFPSLGDHVDYNTCFETCERKGGEDTNSALIVQIIKRWGTFAKLQKNLEN
jgi:hypothetical protein